MTVLQALQLQMPTSIAARMAALSSITVNDFDLNFFIVVIFIELVKQCVHISHAGEVKEDAAFGVLGERTAVHTDAEAVGDIEDLGQELLELAGESAFDGVRAGRDDVIGVLEGWRLVVLEAVVLLHEVEGEDAGDGFAFWAVTMESYCYHSF